MNFSMLLSLLFFFLFVSSLSSATASPLRRVQRKFRADWITRRFLQVSESPQSKRDLSARNLERMCQELRTGVCLEQDEAILDGSMFTKRERTFFARVQGIPLFFT